MMNFVLLLDRLMIEGVETLAPHYSAFSLRRPFQVSGDIQFPKPVAATFANYLYHEQPEDPVKRQKMQELFG